MREIDRQLRQSMVLAAQAVFAKGEEAIARWIAGVKHYYLQNFADSGDILQRDTQFSPVPKDTLNEMLKRVTPFVPGAVIRGK